MWGKFAVALLLLVTAVGCRHEPPAYESRYTEPPMTTAASPLAAPPAAFVDEFNRPELGEGWDMRGPYVDQFPLPPATDGFLQDGDLTYRGEAVVYAVRQFPGPVKRVGTIGGWRQLNDAAAETTMTMAITPNANIVSHMIHFSVTRSFWELTVRRGAEFEPVAEGVFSPPLAVGRDYRFEVEAAPDAVTVRFPGDEVTTPVDIAELIGDRVFWEEYPNEIPAGVVYDFDTVWADY